MSLSADEKFLLNRMNSLSRKLGLGDLLDEAHGVYKVVAAGTFTTAGGDASETISNSEIVASDICMVSVMTAGGTPRSIVAANTGSGNIAVTMSGDPSTDHVLQYVVYRAV